MPSALPASTNPTPEDTVLARGRSVILRQTALTDALSAASATLAGLLPLGAAAVLARVVLANPRGLEKVLILEIAGTLAPAYVGLALLVGLAGAASGVLRARTGWPASWDRALGLPQTVVSIVEIRRRQATLRWAPALVAQATALPAPDVRSLRVQSPIQFGRALGWGSLAATLLWVIAAWIAIETPAPASLDAGSMGVAASADASQPMGPPTDAVATPTGSPAAAGTTELRARITERLRLAEILERFEDTRPIAEWLVRGGRAPTSLALSPGSRGRLADLALELSETSQIAAHFSQWTASPSTDRPIEATNPPESSSSAESVHGTSLDSVQALTQRLIGAPAGGLATFADPMIATGGLDAPTDGSQSSGSEPPGQRDESPLALPGGRALRRGNALPTDSPATPDPGGPAPPVGLLTRPELETHWLPVIERYHERRRTKPTAPGDRASVPPVGKDTR